MKVNKLSINYCKTEWYNYSQQENKATIYYKIDDNIIKQKALA